MDFDTATLSKLSFTIHDSLQEDFKGSVLPGSKPLTAIGKMGVLIVQEITEPLYRLQYNICNFAERTKLRFKEKSDALHASLALKNGIKYSAKGITDIHLNEGQCTILYAPHQPLTAIFEKNIESQLFEMYYSAELIKEFVPFFPFLSDHLSKNKNDKPFTIGDKDRWSCSKIRDISFELLHCSYEEKIRRFYFENKIRECLFVMLAQASESKPDQLTVSREEEDKAYFIKKTLSENINRHLTIPELSRMVGMNEFKLKFVFRQIFGKGMFEFQKEVRLKEAKRLLLDTNKPPKEIARITGYLRITSFITEFRKHFGYTPGSLRRK
ncbi:MAG TPA: AraC family transcriptional regulator [Puia sp.]|nr:AraC family transcriptional regulator [Puia sp.]